MTLLTGFMIALSAVIGRLTTELSLRSTIATLVFSLTQMNLSLSIVRVWNVIAGGAMEKGAFVSWQISLNLMGSGSAIFFCVCVCACARAGGL